MRKLKSRINNWNHQKGFGFVQGNFESSFKDIFVHISMLPIGLEVGDNTYIEYDINETHKGFEVKNVIDITSVEIARIKEESEMYAKIDRQYKEFNNEMVIKYKSLIKELLKKPKDTLEEKTSYYTNLLKLSDKINKEYEDADHGYDGFWEGPLGDMFPNTDNMANCAGCDKIFLKEVINPNYSSHRIYMCDPCTYDVLSKREKIVKSMPSIIGDISNINTKKELKDIARLIVDKYNGFNFSDMDNISSLILGLIIDSGNHNIGYHLPSGGTTRRRGSDYARSYGDLYISGKKIKTNVSWISRNNNRCNGTQVYRIQGSIDDNYDNIIESLKSIK